MRSADLTSAFVYQYQSDGTYWPALVCSDRLLTQRVRLILHVSNGRYLYSTQAIHSWWTWTRTSKKVEPDLRQCSWTDSAEFGRIWWIEGVIGREHLWLPLAETFSRQDGIALTTSPLFNQLKWWHCYEFINRQHGFLTTADVAAFSSSRQQRGRRSR